MGGEGAGVTIVLAPVLSRRFLSLFVCQVTGLFTFLGAGVSALPSHFVLFAEKHVVGVTCEVAFCGPVTHCRHY